MVAIYIKKALKTGILMLGIFYLFSLLWLFSKRIVYPYELDWIEGGMLGSIIQILDGHPLYSAPSITYVPCLYAPVFFYLAALSANIFGASLLALRLVSILASLISLGIIVLMVRTETKSWFWGLASASLFAGLYPTTRLWFDLARVDSLFLMFFLLFLLSLQRSNSLRWQVSAGIFAAMAILTKQSGFTMCLPIIAMYVIFDWKNRLALPLTLALLYGSISLAFIFSSGGWYTYYSYSLLLTQQDNWIPYTFLDFSKDFILPNLMIAAALTLFMFPLQWSSHKSKERLFIWLVIFISTIITSYAGKAKVGGVANVVIPTFAMFSILFGICSAEISRRIQVSSYRHRATAEILVCIVVLCQLAQVVYNPALYIPSFDAYTNSTRALKFVKKFDGNVYAPNSSLALMAGKKPFAHPYAIWEIIHSHGQSQEKDMLKNELQKAVDTQLFDAIVILPSFDYFPNIETKYQLDKSNYLLISDEWKVRGKIFVLADK